MIIETDFMKGEKPEFDKAAAFIADRIREKRPILLRHHADCDGYCGAVALERAVLSIMSDVHHRESDLYYYYRRLPSRAPFYEYPDAVKDLSLMLSDRERFERKSALLIVVDNGSTKQDLLGLRKLKLFGMQIAVIDHHPACAEADSVADVHINTWKKAPGRLSAGMLACEIAHAMHPESRNLLLVSALSAVSDKIEGSESEKVLALAEGLGYSRKRLETIADVVDFEAGSMGFLENRQYVNDLLFGNPEKMEGVVRLLEPYIEREKRRMQKLIKEHASVTGGPVKICTLDWGVVRRGTYPGPSKAAGIAFAGMSHERKAAVVHGEDFATLRISKGLGKSVSGAIAHLLEKSAGADIDGGGHDLAGTLRFGPKHQNIVLGLLREYLEK